MAELKPCPFCGGAVLFENNFARYNVTYHGECEGCGMVFEYTEKHEELTHHYSGLNETRIYHNIMIARNKPFVETWNTRTPKERGEENDKT